MHVNRLHRKATRRMLVIILCLASTLPASAIDGINMLCLDPQVVGFCIWLVCTIYECHTEETAKLGHYNPDLDVLILNPSGVDRVEDPVRSVDTHNRNHNNLIFRDALAIGNLFAGQLFCPSQAKAFIPYFLSTLDTPQWQWGYLDMIHPAAFTPGLREIGHWPFNTWGAVYPRTGWTIQSSIPKAAAVTAQRVGDIVTRVGELHIYLPLTGEADNEQYRVWEPGGLIENTRIQGYWEVLVPQPDPECVVFGVNDVAAFRDWGGGRVTEGGQYAYTLWRPYKCCEIKGTFVESVDFFPYPQLN